MIPSKNTTHLRKLAFIHSLNVRSKEIKTLSTEVTDAFADEWSFIKTPTIILNRLEISQTAAEGIVIVRTHVE